VYEVHGVDHLLRGSDSICPCICHQGRRQRGPGGIAPPMAPKKFSPNNGNAQMPPGLPEFIMGSYYYQRCCNLLQMHRPTQTGRCWSQELRQKNQLNSTEITPDGTIVRAGHRVGYTYTWPGPRWGSLQRSPRPPSWIKGGLLLRGGEGKGGRGWEGRRGEGRGGEGKGSCAPPFLKFLDPSLTSTEI